MSVWKMIWPNTTEDVVVFTTTILIRIKYEFRVDDVAKFTAASANSAAIQISIALWKFMVV